MRQQMCMLRRVGSVLRHPGALLLVSSPGALFFCLRLHLFSFVPSRIACCTQARRRLCCADWKGRS